MTGKIITTSILLIGTVLMINGVAVKAEDILASASSATDQANLYQFRTALDLYYVDHNSYPDVVGGAALLDALKNGNYIRENAPPNLNNFSYQADNNGQNYLLELNNN